MNEMIERVKAAIENDLKGLATIRAVGGPYESSHAENYGKRLDAAARAAIEVMREPSEGMKVVGQAFLDEHEYECGMLSETIWDLMIKAAISA